MYTVTAVRHEASSTVATGTATDNETGETVVFATDWRPALAIGEAISTGETVEVELESWQILSRSATVR